MSDERWIHIEHPLRSSTERAYRAFTDPEEIVRWFAQRVEGSLAVGTRSVLVFERDSRWVDVLEAEPNRRVVLRWPRLSDETLVTTITVTVARHGMGSLVTIADGPFDLEAPAVLDAWADAREAWGAGLAQLCAYLDYSVDLRLSGT
ncbi:MAG TPA: SRPBCC domain-containing protein [Candidatus Limnocylindrales bacterium]|nr:SRPBCC domain-containing protein [Candidatus Limnocylindrales bacterium]